MDLDALERGSQGGVRSEPWHSADPLLDRVGSWGGPAAALCVMLRQPGRDEPFLVAAGECVARGLPTAARAVVMAKSPLTGGCAEGSVGSDLGRRLARVTDLLHVHGHTRERGAVLVLDEGGGARLLCMPELVGLDQDTTHDRISARLGSCATLRVGPAGEDGVAFANLAAGRDPTSFVGRGGLGAALARHGLKAIAVLAPPVESSAQEDLLGALVSSPRLEGRAAGGTLELSQAMSSRGALLGRGWSEALTHEPPADLELQARDAPGERYGCKGCPTPCGWVFGQGEERGAARFSALHATGANLGLRDFDEARRLLTSCNRLGVDAKEAGAVLAVLALAREQGRVEGEAAWGDVAAMGQLLEDLLAGGVPGVRLVAGSQRLARDLGLEEGTYSVGGQAARPDTNLAVVLGECAGARGPEPTRTFTFLVGEGAGPGRLKRMLAPVELPPGAEDPRSPAGKGRLVWWHENLMMGLDLTGFCSFAAAGLLADGVLGLEDLALHIAAHIDLELTHQPAGAGPATTRLLAAGATLAALRHRLEFELRGAPPEEPAWARAQLRLPGMLDEYRLLRGLDALGVPRADLADELGSARVLEASAALQPVSGPARRDPELPGARELGAVRLRCVGPLAQIMGRDTELRLPLPGRVVEVLEAAAQRWPEARRMLLVDGEPLPAVHRDQLTLGPADRVRDGDVLDLVLVVSGG